MDYVAAKVSEVEAIQNFLQETALLKDLQHPHLLPVVGVCITASDDPMVVSPFMATEDLKSYIREPSKVRMVMDGHSLSTHTDTVSVKLTNQCISI